MLSGFPQSQPEAHLVSAINTALSEHGILTPSTLKGASVSLRPAHRVTVLLTKGQPNSESPFCDVSAAQMTCFLRLHCGPSPLATLGIQIQKKAQIESGVKKEENIQRKTKEVRKFREEIHMAEEPVLTIRLESDSRGLESQLHLGGKEKCMLEASP